MSSRLVPRLAVCWLLAVPSAFAADTEVVAKMGELELSAQQLKKIIADAQSNNAASPSLSPVDLDRLARTELVRRALLAEAKAKSWDQRPETVTQLERAREQALVQSYVNGLARPPAGYPSEAELAAVYDASKPSLAVPRQFRVAQIFLAVPKDADKAAAERIEARAGELAGKARTRPAEFAELARQHSQSAESVERGGDMGWLTDGQIVSEIRAALDKLPVGAVSAPVRTTQGWHVLRLLEDKPSAVRPLAEVREALVRAMRMRKAEENERQHLDELLARTPISVNEIVLSRLQAANK